MIKIAICGIAGRMCGRIAHLALDSDDIEISGGVEAAGNRAVGRDLGEVIGARPLGVRVVDNLEQVAARADVVVAFTAPPDGTVEAATVAGAAGTAMVVGTTGMSEAQLASFEEAVKDVACVFAPNFTVGVTLLTQLVEEATRILGADYDVEIVEAHHRFKTDAPSGTALALAKEEAGIDPDREVTLVAYPRPRTFFEQLSDSPFIGMADRSVRWMASPYVRALASALGPLQLFRSGEPLTLMPFVGIR